MKPPALTANLTNHLILFNPHIAWPTLGRNMSTHGPFLSLSCFCFLAFSAHCQPLAYLAFHCQCSSGNSLTLRGISPSADPRPHSTYRWLSLRASCNRLKLPSPPSRDCGIPQHFLPFYAFLVWSYCLQMKSPSAKLRIVPRYSQPFHPFKYSHRP